MSNDINQNESGKSEFTVDSIYSILKALKLDVPEREEPFANNLQVTRLSVRLERYNCTPVEKYIFLVPGFFESFFYRVDCLLI